MGRLSTVLGQDVLVLQRFSGVERMSDLFDFTVDCLAASSDIDFDALIGPHATVTLETTGGERAFDGIVTEARWLGAGENGQRYSLRLQPWFFLATLRRNQRIFHNKTVVEIVSEVLSDHAAAGAFEVQLSGSYPVLEYTVQFRESDFAFVSRMLERHGISYHFQHVEGAHTLVLSDMVESHPNIGTRPYHPDEGHHQEEVEHFWAWRPARRVTTGAIKLTDYNFKTPNAAMVTHATGDAAYAQGQIESYDWPGDYLDQGRGKVLARLGASRERGQDRRFEAEGDIPALAAGTRVTLAGDTVPGTGAEYLCLSATHSYTSDNYGTGGTEGDGFAYSGQYVLMPSTAPMLPELKTTRADVRGPQTAKVVGEGEIDCDEYGRILVQFHWDLDGAYSMRCRVSQNWAGAGWGGMVIPRIGMEVLVEFLDGDPDQPLVTGCVYNAANMPPYDLPANKTRSAFKTKTHQGRGFNELMFEDKLGFEKIYLHAERDHEIHIENNRAKRVDVTEIESIGNCKLSEIGKDLVTQVGGDAMVVIGASRVQLTAPQPMPPFDEGLLQQAYSATVPRGADPGRGHYRVMVAKSFNQQIGTQATTRVGDSASLVVGTGYHLSVGASAKETIGKDRFETIGGGRYMHVKDQIDLRCGASRLVLKSNGEIELTGAHIKLSAGRIDLN
ncbi:type VI secretion system secreted protein VgrG [Rhodobacter aestuarii]|uniref:Type VI secretion system secreted protein VgrG n=2 Tax=Rhodobacter aestuarii TaxID=453582 RepID=A0A1N7PYQ1_9RHOB|nr:type VI secretion system secreted protein VgrG [Rhodobacter aestuarii]SIT15732.1 type VI secretion system secreted protein VgrG [Rhodobacter aestuarii]